MEIETSTTAYCRHASDASLSFRRMLSREPSNGMTAKSDTWPDSDMMNTINYCKGMTSLSLQLLSLHTNSHQSINDFCLPT